MEINHPTTKKIKVLILAYDFPPYVSVGGIRPFNWMKFMPEYDVEPIVITRQWTNHYGNALDYIAPGESNEVLVEKNKGTTIYKTPYFPNLSNRILLKYGESKFKLVRKLISAYYRLFEYSLPIGPQIELMRFANKYLSENKVDFIIATGEPFVLFKYASQLSRKFNTPWIADYRDPWSQGFYYENKPILRFWNSLFEKKYVQSATFISTVDLLFQSKIQKLFPTKTIHILPNGYNPDALKIIEGIEQQSKQLRISFVGTIYDWHPVKVVFNSFNEFIISKKQPNIKLIFYGITNGKIIDELISSEFPILKNYVEIVPRLPNEELLVELAKNNASLLFNYYAFTGTKIYDYLAVKRKIILCFENDKEANELKDKYFFKLDAAFEKIRPQIDIIKNANAGKIVKDSNELISVFEELYTEFETKGKIECTSGNVDSFSRNKQVEKLCEMLKA